MEPLPEPTDPSLFFRGREGDPRLGEWVKPLALDQLPVSSLEPVVLFGCPDDEGVKRNRGRVGAKGGPDAIRRHLYKMTPPMDFVWEDRLALWDAGNIVPADDIDQTHQRAQSASAALTAFGATVIALGGGHDFAAPNFLGFMDGLSQRHPKAQFALVSVDPHLDMRPLEEGKPHSGTPFRVLLERLPGKRFTVFGARANRNARSHYSFAQKSGVKVLPLEQIRGQTKLPLALFRSALSRHQPRVQYLGVTFDMDACADTEGTSAAPVVGFTAWELVQMAALAGRTRAVRYLEIAEVAPPLDAHERAARIAAEMIYAFLRSRAETLSPAAQKKVKTSKKRR